MRNAVIVATSVVALVVAAAAFAFAFGTPQTPVAPSASPPAAQAPASAAEPLPTAAQAPSQAVPVEENAPFAVQIPGCRCHSDDPAVVEEHSRYRMSECRSCHSGDSPMTGAP